MTRSAPSDLMEQRGKVGGVVREVSVHERDDVRRVCARVCEACEARAPVPAMRLMDHDRPPSRASSAVASVEPLSTTTTRRASAWRGSTTRRMQGASL